MTIRRQRDIRVLDFQNARINTAGAYVFLNGLYVFTLGIKPYNGRIPIVRLGGHRLEHETAWQCAERELYEEADLHIRPLTPPTTYLADGDHLDADLQEIEWQHGTDQRPVPLLVTAYRIDGRISLSMMYLARADGSLTPSSEVKGLILLNRVEIHRVCHEALTLQTYLDCGGQAILNAQFDRSLVLEPFAQLRLLERILTRDTANYILETSETA